MANRLDELLAVAAVEHLNRNAGFAAVAAQVEIYKAAPDLLRELKGMVRVWKNGWKVDQDIYIQNAEAAIFKADPTA